MMIAIYVLCAVLLLTLVFLLIFAKSVLKVGFGKRCEGNPLLRYFTAEDFENLSGSAINEMANRGIINSSVTAKALGSAAAEAENNYWNDQIKLLGYSYGTDKKGLAEDLSSTFTKSFVKSLF